MKLDNSALSSVEIVALTIYGEARGEAIEGQIAVGCVIRNRHNDGNSYFEVCTAPKQFSCWNKDDPNRAMLDELVGELIYGTPNGSPILMQCFWIAEGIVDGKIIDNVRYAKNYLTSDLYHSVNKPNWAGELKLVDTIGKHVFLA